MNMNNANNTIFVSTLFFLLLYNISSTLSETCLPINNSHARIWNSNSLNNGLFSYANQQLKKIFQYLPNTFENPLSLCLGSSNISIQSILSDSRCIETVRDFMPILNRLVVNVTNNSDYKVEEYDTYPVMRTFYIDLVMHFKEMVNSITDAKIAHQCTTLETIYNPCLRETIIPLAMKQVFKRKCCRDFMEEVHKELGVPVSDQFLEELLTKLQNVFCSASSEVVYADDGKTKIQKRCGSSLINTFMKHDKSHETILAFLQLPKDQACKAYTGKEFVMTTGRKEKAFSSYGSCTKPLDAFISYLIQFPCVRERFDRRALVDDGTCIQADQLKKVQELTKMYNSTNYSKLNDFCIHIATNFSSNCQYDDSIVGTINFGLYSGNPNERIFPLEQSIDTKNQGNKCNLEMLFIIIVTFVSILVQL